MVQSTNAPALVSSGFKRRQAQRAAQVRCRTRLLPAGAVAAAHAPGALIGTSGLQEQEAAAKEEEKKSKRRRTTDESSHHTKAVSGTTRCNFAIAPFSSSAPQSA